MLCDIKNSRQLKNREAVQYQLIKTLKKANLLFSHCIKSSFLITCGDEWQGLLKYTCDYIDILDFFRRKMRHIDFYCGIGIGEISINNFELTVNQLDGPSFHLAREAMKIAKKNNYYVVIIEKKSDLNIVQYLPRNHKIIKSSVYHNNNIK